MSKWTAHSLFNLFRCELVSQKEMNSHSAAGVEFSLLYLLVAEITLQSVIPKYLQTGNSINSRLAGRLHRR